jgi:methyl-accepting chemotaxis protein
MPKKNPDLGKYKKKISDKLEKLIPVFQMIANGDFSAEIKIPREEDEFTPLIITLNMLLDDLRFLDKENKSKTAELEKSKSELETKVEERTKELKDLAKQLEEKVKERTKDLEQKVWQLENFQKITVDRELKMIELKKETEKIKKQLEECQQSGKQS